MSESNMGLIKQVLKRVKMKILFDDLLNHWVTQYSYVETTNYDYHEVFGMTLRSYLKEYALELAKVNEIGDSIPVDRDSIDTLISWGKDGYIVELAWVGYEEVGEDDVVE